ncbi:hypothetical protein [Streptomyces sp. NPDC005953]
MARTKPGTDRGRRAKTLTVTVVGSIVGGAVSGAVRALTTWLLDR